MCTLWPRFPWAARSWSLITVELLRPGSFYAMGNASKEHPLPCSTLSAQLGLPQSLLMLRLLLTVPLSPHSPFLLCMSHLHHSLTALPAHSCLLSTLFFTDVFLNKSFAHVITFCLLFPGRPRLIQCQSSNSYLIYRIFFFFNSQRGSVHFIRQDLPKMCTNRSRIQLHAPSKVPWI